MVLTALDGPFQLMTCAGPQAEETCDLAEVCPVRSPLKVVHDRLLAVILNVKSLKELIAFPKNIDGTCSLTGTPNFIDSLD